jgi:hypothetical protein
MAHELEDFAIAKARRKRIWARDRRKAIADAAAAAAAAAAAQEHESEQELEQESEQGDGERVESSAAVKHIDADGTLAPPPPPPKVATTGEYLQRYTCGLSLSGVDNDDELEALLEGRTGGADSQSADGGGGDHYQEPAFDYAGALEAVDRITLNFSNANESFAFPDDGDVSARPRIGRRCDSLFQQGSPSDVPLNRDSLDFEVSRLSGAF